MFSEHYEGTYHRLVDLSEPKAMKNQVLVNKSVFTLGTGGWGEWFNNSDHPQTKWLLRDIELVPSVSHGLKNVTGSFYLPLRRPYTFLASKAHLLHVLNTNYT